jgi:hypothetical protein
VGKMRAVGCAPRVKSSKVYLNPTPIAGGSDGPIDDYGMRMQLRVVCAARAVLESRNDGLRFCEFPASLSQPAMNSMIAHVSDPGRYRTLVSGLNAQAEIPIGYSPNSRN